MQLSKIGATAWQFAFPPMSFARSASKKAIKIRFRAAGDGAIEVVSEAQRREEAIASLRQFRGRMPADFKFDRDEANARGPN